MVGKFLSSTISISTKGILCAVFSMSLWACGGEDIDEEDELGVEQDEGKYELVILEPEEENSDSVAHSDVQIVDEKEIPEEGSGESAVVEEAGDEKGGIADGEVDGDTAKPVRFSPGGAFTVQIGLFTESQAARKLVQELTAEGYPVYAVGKPGGKGVRVRIGYFDTREDAQHFGEIFKADRGMDFWVDRRKNEN